jgi:hypothetical protein
MRECLTALLALSHANTKGKGINSKGWDGNNIFRLAKEMKKWDLWKRSPKKLWGEFETVNSLQDDKY